MRGQRRSDTTFRGVNLAGRKSTEVMGDRLVDAPGGADCVARAGKSSGSTHQYRQMPSNSEILMKSPDLRPSNSLTLARLQRSVRVFRRGSTRCHTHHFNALSPLWENHVIRSITQSISIVTRTLIVAGAVPWLAVAQTSPRATAQPSARTNAPFEVHEATIAQLQTAMSVGRPKVE